MTELSFDFTDVKAMTMDGGYAPPQGAYQMTIAEATVEASKAPGQNLVISFNVTQGEHAGSGLKSWFPIPNGLDAKKDAFKLGKMKRLFLGLGVPANALASRLNMTTDQMKGRPVVVYVEDREPDPASGKRRYDAHVVLPEDAQAALQGQWSPRGGRKIAQPGATAAAPAPAAANPFAAAPAPAPAANPGENGGGFDFAAFQAPAAAAPGTVIP
jgi:hypothetical protein